MLLFGICFLPELGIKYGRRLPKIFEDVVEAEGGTVKHVLENQEYGVYKTSPIENYILREASFDIRKYEDRMMVAADFQTPKALPIRNSNDGNTSEMLEPTPETRVAIDMLFNHQPYHTPAMVLNVAGNFLLRYALI